MKGDLCREYGIDLVVCHLVRHWIRTHTSCLARHCRRNTANSLPRDMPTTIDELMEVRVIGTGRSQKTCETAIRQVQAASLT
jgi:hypothetical protein